MLGPVLLLLVGQAHPEAYEAHRGEPPVEIRRVFRAPGDPGEPRVRRVVYGYYPYWVDQFDQVRWDLLTHIAYFAVNVESNGDLGTTNGWPNQSFVDTAHDFGVKVEVSFTLFSGAGITALCSSEVSTSNAVTNMIDAMESGGADGINVDFEGLQSGTRDCFTGFIRALREELTSRGHDRASISIAGPAVDWGDNFDLAELSRLIDVYFIMGYGYHWTRSAKPGPIGQLRVTDAWRPHVSISMQRTLAYYTAQIPAELRSVIVFGVPYYGRSWPTESDQMHSPTTADGDAVVYAAARRALESGRTRRWDPESMNPWYAYPSGGAYRQTWYDDEESLAAKYQLALEQGLGGVGIWALGYDEDYPELWDTLDAYFTAEPDPREGDRSTPIPVDTFPFQDSRDTRAAPSNFFNAYGCRPETPEYGREWVYAVSICRPGRIEVAVTDGPGVDVDLHLLGGLTEADCLMRHDSEISFAVEPGTYFLVADSYVSDLIPQEGAFDLTVDFVPDDPEETCDDGPVFERTVAIFDADVPAFAWTPKAVDTPRTEVTEMTEMKREAAGCGCTAAERPSGGLWALLGLMASVLRLRRRASARQ